MAGEQMKQLRLSEYPRLYPVTWTNGPGLRYTMWVQGCSIKCCKNCLNPELLEADSGVMVDVEECLGCINTLKDRCGIEGITILGGEPFDQAETLSKLLFQVRSIGLSVMLYTGHDLETLEERAHVNHAFDTLLNQVDILVEGRFDKSFSETGVLWRGSMNQRIVFLSNRYDVETVKKWITRKNNWLKGKIQVRYEYFDSILVQKHWLEPLPVSVNTASNNMWKQKVEIKRLKFNGHTVVSWIPELNSNLEGNRNFRSPKGLSCIIESDNSIHLYGFQKPEVIQRFQQQLRDEGIFMQLENRTPKKIKNK